MESADTAETDRQRAPYAREVRVVRLEPAPITRLTCASAVLGYYLTDLGTDANLHDDISDCAECASGKVSSSDRSSCEDCGNPWRMSLKRDVCVKMTVLLCLRRRDLRQLHERCVRRLQFRVSFSGPIDLKFQLHLIILSSDVTVQREPSVLTV